jgi:hypothetical protein
LCSWIETPHPSRTFVRATFSHKGRRLEFAAKPIRLNVIRR